MSRIHEALRRAEEERSQQRSTTGDQRSLSMDTLVEAAPSNAWVPSGGASQAMPATEVAEASVPAGLDYQTLAERCSRPEWKPDTSRLLFVDSDSHERVGAEEFRTLRSRLYQLKDKQPLRSILIASALPAEGKTFTAANLAQLFVRQRGRRVLLIDADLRAPQLHVNLGAPSTPGLSEYLRGEADEFTVIQRGCPENLFFLPGGKVASNPTELIANGRLKFLLQRMEPIFDWIVLDAPPVVPLSDASVIADVCDGVLLVLRAAATPFELAQKARQEFRDKPLLGVVLNRVAPTSSDYYYSYGYGNGNKRQKRK